MLTATNCYFHNKNVQKNCVILKRAQLIHADTYQHVFACIELVFGMYETMIRANTDQIHAFDFKTCQLEYRRKYIRQYDHKPIQVLIQTNISTNTSTKAHIIVFNTCTSTCQYKHWYCQIKRPRPHRPHSQHPLLPMCHRYLNLPSCTRPLQQDQPQCYHILLFVVRQFLSVLRQPNFSRLCEIESEISECRIGRMTLQ